MLEMLTFEFMFQVKGQVWALKVKALDEKQAREKAYAVSQALEGNGIALMSGMQLHLIFPTTPKD